MRYRVIYSKRKTIAIQVERDGGVLVRCPYGVSRAGIERFLSAKEAWIKRQQERIANRVPYPDDPVVIEKLRRQAREELIPKTRAMADRFGLKVNNIRISSARSRFGSCSAKNNISLSLFLMLYPAQAREYVILHELCHTVEHNHSSRFYALLDRFMPDHRERRRLLR